MSIDEITLIPGFDGSAHLLSDYFAALGMRVVLSGSDSLGFWLASYGTLYGRMVTVHTTHIPFATWSRMAGTDDVDDYLECGGAFEQITTASDGYAAPQAIAVFSDAAATRLYIETAIVRNIEDSLKRSRYGLHLGALDALRKGQGLSSIVTRVIDLLVLDYIQEVVEQRLSSYGLVVAGERLDVERQRVKAWLCHARADLDVSARLSGADERARKETKACLDHLEVTCHVRVVTLPHSGIRNISNRAVFIQPGMCFCLAQVLVRSMALNEERVSHPGKAAERVVEQVLDGVRERLLADVVLVETSRALGNEHEVFELVVEGYRDSGPRSI